MIDGNRMLTLTVILLCLGVSGLALSVYMTVIFLRVQRGQSAQCFDATCPMVMRTPYARTLGFPNTYLALLFYLALVVYSCLRLAGAEAWLFVPVAAATGLSLLMSAYLIYALLVKLKQACFLCMLGHGLNAAVAVVVIMMWWFWR